MFKDCPETQELKGNNDLLVFTQPDTIREIHRRYFECGADICETNTFSGTVIAQARPPTRLHGLPPTCPTCTAASHSPPHVSSQADYGMEHVVYDLNKIGCELAVDAAKEITSKEPNRPRLVAGAVGPTNRTLSISPSVEDPGFRNCTWDEVVSAYKQQVKGLVDGGAHIILVETIFDSCAHTSIILSIAPRVGEGLGRLRGGRRGWRGRPHCSVALCEPSSSRAHGSTHEAVGPLNGRRPCRTPNPTASTLTLTLALALALALTLALTLTLEQAQRQGGALRYRRVL